MPTLAEEIVGYRVYGMARRIVLMALCPKCAAPMRPGCAFEPIMGDELDVVEHCDLCDSELS